MTFCHLIKIIHVLCYTNGSRQTQNVWFFSTGPTYSFWALLSNVLCVVLFIFCIIYWAILPLYCSHVFIIRCFTSQCHILVDYMRSSKPKMIPVMIISYSLCFHFRWFFHVQPYDATSIDRDDFHLSENVVRILSGLMMLSTMPSQITAGRTSLPGISSSVCLTGSPPSHVISFCSMLHLDFDLCVTFSNFKFFVQITLNLRVYNFCRGQCDVTGSMAELMAKKPDCADRTYFSFIVFTVHITEIVS